MINIVPLQITNKEGSAESTAKLAVAAAKKDKAPKFASELKSQKAKEGGDVKFKVKVLMILKSKNRGLVN